jgi:hypothetical protein
MHMKVRERELWSVTSVVGAVKLFMTRWQLLNRAATE